MSKSYDEIMEKIYMSEEAHDRILSNVVKECSEGSSAQSHILQMQKPLRYLAVAAAVLVCVIAVPVIYHLQKGAVKQEYNNTAGISETDRAVTAENSAETDETVMSDEAAETESADETTMLANGIVECASAEELSQKVGFAIFDLKKEALPFKVNSTAYYSYWDYLAEIEYDGENGEYAAYRMQAGDEDPSGDYNEYSQQDTVTLKNKNIQVSLKGNDTSYNLAVWTYEGYSCSLYFSEGISKEDFMKILEKTEMHAR